MCLCLHVHVGVMLALAFVLASVLCATFALETKLFDKRMNTLACGECNFECEVEK